MKQSSKLEQKRDQPNRNSFALASVLAAGLASACVAKTSAHRTAAARVSGAVRESVHDDVRETWTTNESARRPVFAVSIAPMTYCLWGSDNSRPLCQTRDYITETRLVHEGDRLPTRLFFNSAMSGGVGRITYMGAEVEIFMGRTLLQFGQVRRVGEQSIAWSIKVERGPEPQSAWLTLQYPATQGRQFDYHDEPRTPAVSSSDPTLIAP